MQIQRLSEGSFRIDLSPDELSTIGNCLNEVANGIEIFEFQTRIGVERDEVQKLLDLIVLAYRS